jgi:hypothetical protein
MELLYALATTEEPQPSCLKYSIANVREPRRGRRAPVTAARVAPRSERAPRRGPFNWQNKTALHRPARSRTPGALLTSILGFTRTVSHHPARHSLFLRRPDDTPAYACNKRSPHGHAVTVSLSSWCARSILQSCVSLGSRRPAVHVPTLGHSPRSLPHAKCASAVARKGSEEALEEH